MFRNIINILKTNVFLRNILTLFSASSAGMFIPIILSPILTRMFSPEDFGLLGVYSSLVAVLSIISSMRYELSIILPESDEDGIKLFFLTIGISLIFNILLFGLILILRNVIVDFFNIPLLYNWLLLLPLSVFMTTAVQAFTNLYNRSSLYKKIGLASIVTSTGGVFSQVTIGFSKILANGGLIVGQLFGRFFGLLVYLSNPKIFYLQEKKNLKTNLKTLANRYENFPKFELPSSILNSVSSQLPVFLLAYFFNSTILGFYSFAHKIIVLPINLLGRSISKVFYKEANIKVSNPKKLSDLTSNIFKVLILLGVIPFSFLTFFGGELFSFVFGKEWHIAGVYAQYLSSWLFLVFITSPLSVLFNVFELQKINLRFNALFFILRLCVLIIGGLYANAETTILIFSIVSFLLWAILTVYLLKLAKVKSKKIILYIFTIIPPIYAVLGIIKYYI